MQVELPPSIFSQTTNELVREVAADAPSLIEIGLTTAAGIAGGGGALAAGIGGYRLLKQLFTKNRTSNQEPQKGGDQIRQQDAPFPRSLDEARQLREIRQHTELRVPEYDAAVGRILEDEVELHAKFGDANQQAVIKDFYYVVKTRADKLMPPSTREYRE